MPVIPTLKNINTPIEQAAPSPTGAGRASTGVDIGSGLQGISNALMNYSNTMSTLNRQERELELDQERKKQIGEYNTRLVQAKDELQNFATELYTKPEYKGLDETARKTKLAELEQRKTAEIFPEGNTPQWVVDAYQSQWTNITGTVDQQLQASQIQTNMHLAKADYYDAVTNMETFVDGTIADKGLKTTKEKENQISELYKQKIKDLETQEMPVAERQTLNSEYQRLAAKAQDKFKEKTLEAAHVAQYTANIKEYNTRANSPDMWVKEGVDHLATQVDSMVKPPKMTDMEFAQQQIQMKSKAAYTYGSHTTSTIADLKNEGVRIAKAKEFKGWLEAKEKDEDGNLVFKNMTYMDIDQRDAFIAALEKASMPPKKKDVVYALQDNIEDIAKGDELSKLSLGRGIKVPDIDVSSPSKRVASLAQRDALVKILGASNYLMDREVSKIGAAASKGDVNNTRLALEALPLDRLKPSDIERLKTVMSGSSQMGAQVASIFSFGMRRPPDQRVAFMDSMLTMVARRNADPTKESAKYNKAKESVFAELDRLSGGTLPINMKKEAAEAVALATTYGGMAQPLAINNIVGRRVTIDKKYQPQKTDLIPFGRTRYSDIFIPHGVSEYKLRELQRNTDLYAKQLGLPAGFLDNAQLNNVDGGYAFVRNGQYVLHNGKMIGPVYSQVAE